MVKIHFLLLLPQNFSACLSMPFAAVDPCAVSLLLLSLSLLFLLLSASSPQFQACWHPRFCLPPPFVCQISLRIDAKLVMMMMLTILLLLSSFLRCSLSEHQSSNYSSSKSTAAAAAPTACFLRICSLATWLTYTMKTLSLSFLALASASPPSSSLLFFFFFGFPLLAAPYETNFCFLQFTCLSPTTTAVIPSSSPDLSQR
jgi:hypothetical protein